MKWLEYFVLKSLLLTCEPHPAYKANRVDLSLLFFTDNVYKHFDIPKRCMRTLFIDFSSAFNSMKPYVLIPKVLEIGL